MNVKPNTCQGCSLYKVGHGFVPDEAHDGSQVAILGLSPSKDDASGRHLVGYAGPKQPIYETTKPSPFIGGAGWLLENTYLPAAGLKRQDVSLHHILKCYTAHPPTGDVLQSAMHHCVSKHLNITDESKVLVTMGKEPWELFQGSLPLTDWRGFPGPKKLNDGKCVIYATHHPQDLYRDPHLRFMTRLDWKKIPSILKGEWPLPIPKQCIASPPTRGEFIRLLEEALCQEEILLDTEYIPSNGLLTHVGAAWKLSNEMASKDGSLTSPKPTVRGFQLEWVHGAATSVERGIFMRFWPLLCKKVKMGFWNAKADLKILEENLHCIPERIEDPMQAHAVLWPDMPHDFEFVASLYGKYPKLKHLSKENILLYHWGDCIDLVWIWEQLKKEFQYEKKCEEKYRGQNLKLIPIILRREREGIKVNEQRVKEAIPAYESLTESAQALAQAYCGFPINLGSTGQLMGYLGSSEGLRLRSMDQDSVAVHRAKYYPFDSEREDREGFSVEYIQTRCNLGAHPLLELRMMYAKNEKINNSYLGPLLDVGRIYPQISIHTQVTGRHSTTNPALATFPDDLRDTVMPDEGQAWIGWDWDAQEPRIQWGESGSRILAAAFTQGIDIHTQFVCDLYGWAYPQDRGNPHGASIDAEWRAAHNWGGKEDPRRVFAKQVRYECVPLDTKILTRDGWKAYEEVIVGEEVLTYNPVLKVKEWGKLTGIVTEWSEVFELRNRSFCIRATAGHRWFVKQRIKKGASWIKPYMVNMELTTDQLNTGSNIIINAPLRADGGSNANYDQPKYGTDWVKEVCHMTRREREAFIRGFALADGHCKPNGVWNIDQKNGPLWDAILTACFINHHGHITACAPHSRNDVKKLLMSKRAHVTMQEMKKKSLGMQRVWCPTTSNGSWVMKQGDQIVITGNCNYDSTEKAYNAQQKAIRMGIEPAVAKKAAEVLLNADPELRQWFKQIMKDGEKTRITRSWGGGRRVYYWADGFAKPPLNEMRNYPLQAGGADLYNLTIVEISERVPFASFVYGLHDSQWWSVPHERVYNALPLIKSIATQERLINGRMIPFPASFKVMYDNGRVEKL